MKNKKINCVSKYIVANEDERKVLRLARTFVRNHYRIWNEEEREFFGNRYWPLKRSFDAGIKFGFNPVASLNAQGIDENAWEKSYRKAQVDCIREAQEIKRRGEIDYKNLTYNVGRFMLEGIIVGFINVIGGMGGGIHYIPNERAYRPNYKTQE